MDTYADTNNEVSDESLAKFLDELNPDEDEAYPTVVAVPTRRERIAATPPVYGPSAWVYDDGGRALAGFRGDAGDCVPRAIAIATGAPYREIYDYFHTRMIKGRSPRNGVPKPMYKGYLANLGWEWTATMFVGSGTTVHLAASELPAGRLVVVCTKHVVAVIDGIIHDTHDPGRGGQRCVYGYWRAGAPPS